MCARVKIIVRVVKLGNSLVFMNSVGKDEMEWKKILIKTIISDVNSLWYNFSTQFQKNYYTETVAGSYLFCWILITSFKVVQWPENHKMDKNGYLLADICIS